MSFDQGAWDRITGLSNQVHRLNEREPEVTREEFVALQARMAEMERRFKEMKKAVWRA